MRKPKVKNDTNTKKIVTHGDQSPGYVAGNYSINQTIVNQYEETNIKKWRQLAEHWYPKKGRPIKFLFYENAGHLLFEGPLKKVTIRRG